MSIRIARALPLILALAACSTPTQRVERLAESEYDPKSSFARNVMMASGRPMIRDGVGPEGGSVTARQGGGSVATIGAGALTGNPGLGVGLGLLRGLTGPGYNQGTSNMVIAWMPAEMAADPIDARNNINALVVDAFRHAFDLMSIDYNFSQPPLSEETARSFPYAVFDFPNANCGRNCITRRVVETTAPLHRVNSPDFLGGGVAFATIALAGYGTPQWEALPIQNFGDDRVIDEIEFYQLISRKLPEWAFIYLAPGQWASCQAADCRYRQYPLLINQGETHNFVRPGADVAAAP